MTTDELKVALYQTEAGWKLAVSQGDDIVSGLEPTDAVELAETLVRMATQADLYNRKAPAVFYPNQPVVHH